MGALGVQLWCFCVLLILLPCVLGEREGLDAGNFLAKFGYLDDLAPGQSGHSERSTRVAIREFQRFNGLRVSGRLDAQTLRKMQQPRCGLPDVIKPSQRPEGLRRGGGGERDRPDPNQPVAFYAPGYKWNKRDVTYKIMGYTRQLGGNEQIDAFHNAFQKWANVVPLDFRKTTGEADMEISFAKRTHSDGPGNSFDGEGGTLAHAFFPGEASISGDTHFDDDEQWTLGTDDGTNLEIVAAHEFGHALGMGHSNVPSALMAPYYQGYDPDYRLHSDDIAGIQQLYGRGRGSVSDGGRPTTPRPIPRPRTTPRPPRRTTTANPRGRYCSLKLDAITENSDGNVYLFRRNMIHQIGSRGIVRRQRTTSIFPNAPAAPGAAVYDRYRRQLFIFKGRRYWRYSNNRLDRGYPRDLPTDFQKVRAAFQWSDGGIYLFTKNNRYTRWAEGLTRFPSGYPRNVRDFWQRAPTNIEAALRGQDGYYYFFKGYRYWKFNSRAQLQGGYPKDSRPAWLSCGAFTPP